MFVSTHATRAGRDHAVWFKCLQRRRFNSRDPCGSRLPLRAIRRLMRRFNSRDPCGSRRMWSQAHSFHRLFQLTRPVRVATLPNIYAKNPEIVSTHATRAGRDTNTEREDKQSVCFNSRDPCGSRLRTLVVHIQHTEFQLTRPVRVATRRCAGDFRLQSVSTHATRAGRDGVL